MRTTYSNHASLVPWIAGEYYTRLAWWQLQRTSDCSLIDCDSRNIAGQQRKILLPDTYADAQIATGKQRQTIWIIHNLREDLSATRNSKKHRVCAHSAAAECNVNKFYRLIYSIQ